MSILQRVSTRGRIIPGSHYTRDNIIKNPFFLHPASQVEPGEQDEQDTHTQRIAGSWMSSIVGPMLLFFFKAIDLCFLIAFASVI